MLHVISLTHPLTPYEVQFCAVPYSFEEVMDDTFQLIDIMVCWIDRLHSRAHQQHHTQNVDYYVRYSILIAQHQSITYSRHDEY